MFNLIGQFKPPNLNLWRRDQRVQNKDFNAVGIELPDLVRQIVSTCVRLKSFN